MFTQVSGRAWKKTKPMRVDMREHLDKALAVAYRLALSLSGDTDDAMDMVESAFQSVLRHPRTCLSSVCFERRLLRAVYLSSLETESDLTTPMPDNTETCSIADALSGLSPQSRAAISLWAGRFRYQEISEILDISFDTVTMLVAEGKEHLKLALGL